MDADLTQRHRAWLNSGSDEDATRWIAAGVRANLLDRAPLELLARLECEPARVGLGLPPGSGERPSWREVVDVLDRGPERTRLLLHLVAAAVLAREWAEDDPEVAPVVSSLTTLERCLTAPDGDVLGSARTTAKAVWRVGPHGPGRDPTGFTADQDFRFRAIHGSAEATAAYVTGERHLETGSLYLWPAVERALEGPRGAGRVEAFVEALVRVAKAWGLAPAATPAELATEAVAYEASGTFPVGATIVHARFGRGIVVQSQGTSIEVEFAGGVRRKLAQRMRAR